MNTNVLFEHIGRFDKDKNGKYYKNMKYGGKQDSIINTNVLFEYIEQYDKDKNGNYYRNKYMKYKEKYILLKKQVKFEL